MNDRDSSRDAPIGTVTRAAPPLAGAFATRALLLVALCAIGTASAATTLALPAGQDLTVSEMHPDGGRRERVEHVLAAGVGRGGRPMREGRMVAYLRFDLAAVPRSNLLRRTAVEDAALYLFVLAHALTPSNPVFRERIYIVSVRSCPGANWTEDTMSWATRACPDEGVAQDTRTVDADALPAQQDWDVSAAFAGALAAGLDHVTLIVDARRLLDCDRDPLEGRGCASVEHVGFLRFASRERASFGASVTPRVVISYATLPTTFASFATSTLALISALATTVGLYAAVRQIRRGESS